MTFYEGGANGNTDSSLDNSKLDESEQKIEEREIQ